MSQQTFGAHMARFTDPFGSSLSITPTITIHIREQVRDPEI